MKLNTYREQIRRVADEWREQYRGECGGNLAAVQGRLDALDKETATAEDVAAAIGNSAWIYARCCMECERESWHTVEFGRGDDAVTLCITCLTAAYNRWMHEG